ncbi:MAG: hypothetical protein II567_12565 [Candidatus Riflebacteria bacterium]|nr:hypothetical protein [Candidatus Riflebacteria bacterium]
MIIVPRKEKENKSVVDDFESNLKDGRLTEPDGKIYRLREVILQMKRLGRMLTEEELKAYELSNC